MMVFPPRDTDPLEANRVFAAQSSLREMIQYMLNSSRTKSKNIEELKQPIDYDLFLSKIDDKNNRWFRRKKKTITTIIKNNNRDSDKSMTTDKQWIRLYK